MTAAPGCWRRLAVRLAQYAAWLLPGAGSPWSDAMRSELDYIASDPAALRWALGCVLGSCRVRLIDRRWFSARSAWRYAATSGVLILVIGLALHGPASGQTEPLRPAFDETACDLPNVSPEIGPRLRCGTVSVPRNYDNPGAGSFKLAVVVIRSSQQPALPEPVVYINGGPGSPLTIHADYQARNPYARGRDLILVDQRGTGRSEPSLCPDLDGELLEANLAVAKEPSEAAGPTATPSMWRAATRRPPTASISRISAPGSPSRILSGCAGRSGSRAGTSMASPMARQWR